MIRLLTVLLLFSTTIANAQELTIKVTPTEADTIWEGLRELPVKKVEVLMQKMRQQIVEQTTPKPPKAEEKK